MTCIVDFVASRQPAGLLTRLGGIRRLWLAPGPGSLVGPGVGT